MHNENVSPSLSLVMLSYVVGLVLVDLAKIFLFRAKDAWKEVPRHERKELFLAAKVWLGLEESTH